MANIYELTGSILEIQRMIEDGNENLFDTLESLELSLQDKLESYTCVIRNIESDIEGFKLEEKRLADKRKSMENSIKRMKQIMQESMEISGIEKFKGEKFSFSIANNPPSLEVLDEDLIPSEFVEVQQVKVIDKKAIMQKLKSGINVEGVIKKQGKSLRIK